MVDFRKLFLVLAVVALTVGASVASAQTITCNTTGNPLTVREEGLAELVGDVLLTCTGGNPADPPFTVNISVTLTTNITSRIMGNGQPEALLFIDDPAPAVQDFIDDAVPPGDERNVFQGIKQSDNTVVFVGIPIQAPGTLTRVYRIKNIRSAVSGFAAANGQILAFLSIQNPTGNLQLNNATAVVGFVQKGLTFSVSRTVGSVLQCVDVNGDLAGDPTKSASVTKHTELRYKEFYNVAFKNQGTATQNMPNINYNTESGFTNNALTGLPTGTGLADHATRLLARFTNVPANVQIWVSVNDINNSPPKAFGVVANALGANTFGGIGTIPITTTQPQGFTQVPISGGTGTFTWEVTSVSDLLLEEVRFSVIYAYKAASNPGTGTPQVNGSLAPLSTVNTMSSTAPVPRFADVTSAVNMTSINTCKTTLLFPFVSNQGGFDTGMAISNTSADTAGTAAQSGTCTLTYFGMGPGGGAAPPPQTTTSAVAAGEQVIWTLSMGGTHGIVATPGFQGYIIADCNFLFAHGYAFISDVGAQKLAQGYLALVMVRGSSAGAEGLNQ